MTETFRLCIIGGSNSLMKNGYTAPLATAIESATGRKVETRNLSIGGTFSHFGLWQVTTKNAHRDADAIIVEYVLNDAELSGWNATGTWVRAYEGLIRRLRHENPHAQIVTPLLLPKRAMLEGQFSAITAGVTFVNLRYGVSTVDVTQELISKAPPGFWNVETEWYRDGAHYVKQIHVMIAELVAARIIRGEGRAASGNFMPISNTNYAGAKSAVREEIFEKILPPDVRFSDFSSSRAHERAALISEDSAGLSFNLTGSLIAIIVISRKNDGVVRLAFGESVIHIALRRRAFDEGEFNFLVNVVIPDQYFKGQVCTSAIPAPVRLDLLSDAAVAADPKVKVARRSTARMPDPGPHELAVVDILYTGDMGPL